MGDRLGDLFAAGDLLRLLSRESYSEGDAEDFLALKSVADAALAAAAAAAAAAAMLAAEASLCAFQRDAHELAMAGGTGNSGKPR